jgi:hypothetical protein
MLMPVEVKVEGGQVQVVRDGVVTSMKPEDLATALDEAKAPLEDRMLTVRVAGQDRQVSVKEALASFSKVGGADAKFQEAAAAMKVAEALGKFQDPSKISVEDFDLILQTAGTPAATRAEAIQMFQQLKDGTYQAQDQQQQQQEPPIEIPDEMLSPAVRQKLSLLDQLLAKEQERTNLDFVGQVEKDVRGVLTSDKTLGTIIASEANGQPVDWAKQDGMAAALFADAMDKVRSRALVDGPRFKATPELYQGIAQELRNRMAQVGKLANSEQAGNTALGPALGMSPRLQTIEPVEPVPVQDPKHSDNFAQRLAHMVAKAGGLVE